MQHDTIPQVGLVLDPLTRTGGRVGAAYSGCADRLPSRSPALGPRARPKGWLAPPPPSSALLPTLSNATELPRRQGDRKFARALPKFAFRFPANLSQAAWTIPLSGREASPPLNLIPLESRRWLLLAAPLSVARDTRRERDARARACAPLLHSPPQFRAGYARRVKGVTERVFRFFSFFSRERSRGHRKTRCNARKWRNQRPCRPLLAKQAARSF